MSKKIYQSTEISIHLEVYDKTKNNVPHGLNVDVTINDGVGVIIDSPEYRSTRFAPGGPHHSVLYEPCIVKFATKAKSDSSKWILERKGETQMLCTIRAKETPTSILFEGVGGWLIAPPGGSASTDTWEFYFYTK